MDRLTSMNVFVKVAESGSFAAAAGQLQLSPQMVAKHIATLEKHLGTLLLHRTTRRQSLTDVGRNYYERCKIVVAEAQEADAIALDMQRRPSGTLKVSAPVTFGSFSLAPFVTRYLGQFPEMEVDLELSDRLVDPFEEGYEVVIRIGELADSSIIAHPLQPYQLIACASPAYLARHGVPATPAELVKHACLVYGIWSPSKPCRWVFTRAGKTEEVHPQGRMRSNDWKALLHAALEGYGITLGPATILAEEIRLGRLVQVLPDYAGPARPMNLLIPAGRRQTVKIRSFVNAILAEFGRYPPTAGSPGDSARQQRNQLRQL
ncbi:MULTISPECIES: LysR family transcriptional regulator [Pantoea]|uniref:LysR family transcriptional regulator n=1 Tax=Pantoea TaxID=53335 RepID=UPI00244D707A|nr:MULTISPECIES: LysR family transcriptional regulator [Pantoea]MDH1085945.1 LysR family transcriptional regulator [Pantoea brenneri]MDU4127966.1 LysR family transcriptional regulator [Pantoea sp.]